MSSSIFIVDNSPSVRRMVEQISTPEGFEVVGFQDGPTALEAARRISPALIIADYHLDNMTFSGFCKEVSKLDHLSETTLISLVHPADRPDEGHLRTLGVKAFLTKPFQTEDLLDLIKSLQDTRHQPSGPTLRRRVWPPVSTATDSDDDGRTDGPLEGANEEEPLIMDHPVEPTLAAPVGQPAATEPQDAMNVLAEQLLQSITLVTEKRVSGLLPALMERTLAAQVRPLVHEELEGQLGQLLSHEQLALIIQPLVRQELPHLIRNELPALEPVIRQIASDLVGASIRETIEQTIAGHVEAGVRKHLPAVVREHLGTIDLAVKEEIREATIKQASLLADDLVRTTASRSVDQAVVRIVPELAEQYIKAELKRLTEEDPPRASAL